MSSSLPPFQQPENLSRESRLLVNLAQSATSAGSRLEQSWWDRQIGTHVGKLLQARKDKVIESALEYLANDEGIAYEVLIEHIETLAESCTMTFEGERFDVLLFSAPIVLWTRYQLPGRSLPNSSQLGQVNTYLHTHVFSSQVRSAFLPELLGFEQMPRSFSDTQRWAQVLGQQAIEGKPGALTVPQELLNEGILAEARFLVGALAVPHGAPLFRWQETPASGLNLFEAAIEGWKAFASQLLGPLFTGCITEFLSPSAFYAGNRQADQQLRSAAVKASITWLQSSAGIQAEGLRATIAACGHRAIEEFRIGLTPRQSSDVIYGCVWPALTKEEVSETLLDPSSTTGVESILELLRSLGVNDIRILPGLFEPETCEDCGAPYFPNPLGEMQHPELPDDFDVNPISFH